MVIFHSFLYVYQRVASGNPTWRAGTEQKIEVFWGIPMGKSSNGGLSKVIFHLDMFGK